MDTTEGSPSITPEPEPFSERLVHEIFAKHFPWKMGEFLDFKGDKKTPVFSLNTCHHLHLLRAKQKLVTKNSQVHTGYLSDGIWCYAML